MISNDEIRKYNNIIIFGAGTDTVLYEYVIREFSEKIKAIIDNDENKQGKKAYGVDVFSADCLSNFNKKDTLIISCVHHYNNEIKKQIEQLGWKDNFIIAAEDMASVNSYEFSLLRYGITPDNIMPIILNLELSGICNCKCVYCSYHSEKHRTRIWRKDLMSWDTLIAVVEQAKKIRSFKRIFLVGAGELFVNPEWFEMTQYVIKETGIHDVYLYTNGTLLNEKNIDKIMELDTESLEIDISLDGRSPEENDRWRIGAKYEEIKSNIYMLMDKKAKRNKVLSLYLSHNHPVLESEIGGRTFIERDSAIPPQYLVSAFPDMEIRSVYTQLNSTFCCDEAHYGFKIRKFCYPTDYPNRCQSCYTTLSVNNNGDLLRCMCGEQNKDRILKNVRECDLLDQFINDKKMNEAREHLLKGICGVDFCDGCILRGMGEYYLAVQ